MKIGSYFEVRCLLILSPSAAAVWRAAAEGDAGELKGIKNKIKFLFEAVAVLKRKTKKEKEGNLVQVGRRPGGAGDFFFFFKLFFFFDEGI